MNKKIMMFMLIIVFSIFIFGCSPDDGSYPDNVLTPPEDIPILPNDNQVIPEDFDSVVDGNNQFAVDMYNKLKNDGDNVFFSPYSISSALAMTYEGANGETAEEMRNVLHFPEDGVELRSSFAQLYNLLNKPDKKYKLSTANALWAEQTYSFLPEYLGLVEQYYGGKTTNLDFKEETEKSRKIINKWVEDKTEDKIKDLIPKGVIRQDTRLVLTNAIYFFGDWNKKFKKENTEERDFFVSEDEIIDVDMMFMVYGFNYVKEDGVQILEIPYKGKELSMLVVLPKLGEMDLLEQQLTGEKIAEWNNNFEGKSVRLSLPKFKFEAKVMLAKTLQQMGMPTAFSPVADFSGMDGTKLLNIDQVIHQAFVAVDEKGTEAAAATAVVMKETMAMPMDEEPEKPIEFKANHPFIFLIQEKSTGSILFMGKVNDPLAE
jgi:serpin B